MQEVHVQKLALPDVCESFAVPALCRFQKSTATNDKAIRIPTTTINTTMMAAAISAPVEGLPDLVTSTLVVVVVVVVIIGLVLIMPLMCICRISSRRDGTARSVPMALPKTGRGR